jgi:hypothetical protein
MIYRFIVSARELHVDWVGTDSSKCRCQLKRPANVDRYVNVHVPDDPIYSTSVHTHILGTEKIGILQFGPVPLSKMDGADRGIMFSNWPYTVIADSAEEWQNIDVSDKKLSEWLVDNENRRACAQDWNFMLTQLTTLVCRHWIRLQQAAVTVTVSWPCQAFCA